VSLDQFGINCLFRTERHFRTAGEFRVRRHICTKVIGVAGRD
jgi:hypothetical protein